jgi:hypothetical protein
VTDYFISYTSADEAWAEWIAWTLEDAGFSVTVQKWDFAAGSNFVLEMQRAAARCKRTIAVLSPRYLESAYGAAEWAAAFGTDPEGLQRKLVPVRVAECKPEGLMKALVQIDLVSRSEEEACRALLGGVAEGRAKPRSKPDFPGKASASAAPVFPGTSSGGESSRRAPDRNMPKLRGNPSDLEKRRFLKDAFETIRAGFHERLNQLAGESKGVDVDLTQVDSTKFSAEVFVNGQSRGRCKIWLGGMFGADGISYAEGPTSFNENACNEVFALSDRGELALHAIMNMGLGNAGEGLDTERLSPEEATEYLWRRFCWRLS